MKAKDRIKYLEGVIIAQIQQIKLLEDKVLFLLECLAKYSEKATVVKKDSHNSSLPPSSDIIPQTKSLRVKSERKSGGQLGHVGYTLEMRSEADVVIDLKVTECENCGGALSSLEHVLKSKRQVIELPPVVPIYEEYRQYGCTCPHCHSEQVAKYPLGVNAPIQYGSSVEALVSYLSVAQYVPFLRLQYLFKHIFSLPLSQGTVGNILERTALKCKGVYERIKEEIAQSEVVGSDETGAKVNGAKWWIWVWQNILNTFIVASDNRGSATIEATWGDSLQNVILITDRWAAQLKTSVKGKQICLAHLLRNVIFLEESEKHPFASEFKALILTIFKAKKTLIAQKLAYTKQDDAAILLEKQLILLLAIPIDKDIFPKTAIFQNAIIQYQKYILPCIYKLEIPPDNNGSERAIRNIKVKQKVSGQFKSGQNAFCVIRSVIDTLRKRKVDVFTSLVQIIKLQPV